jgi:hypothetical protein
MNSALLDNGGTRTKLNQLLSVDTFFRATRTLSAGPFPTFCKIHPRSWSYTKTITGRFEETFVFRDKEYATSATTNDSSETAGEANGSQYGCAACIAKSYHHPKVPMCFTSSSESDGLDNWQRLGSMRTKPPFRIKNPSRTQTQKCCK